VNAYAEAYIADGIRATVRSAEERAVWMEARLQDLRTEAQAAAEAAEQFRRETGVADQQGLRELEQQAEALNDLVLRFQNRYRELALESSFPVSAGRILSRALPPRDPSAPRATHVLAAGVFLGLLWALPWRSCARRAKPGSAPAGGCDTRTWACRSWAMCRPSGRGAPGTAAARILGWPGARSGHGRGTDQLRARTANDRGEPRACRPAIWPNPRGSPAERAAPHGTRARVPHGPAVRAGRARRLQRPRPARADATGA
jgi:hypothetical protein